MGSWDCQSRWVVLLDAGMGTRKCFCFLIFKVWTTIQYPCRYNRRLGPLLHVGQYVPLCSNYRCHASMGTSKGWTGVAGTGSVAGSTSPTSLLCDFMQLYICKI